jgi:hypothetical protein
MNEQEVTTHDHGDLLRAGARIDRGIRRFPAAESADERT